MKTLLIVLVLSGCASFEGVEMNEKERKACALETCGVYTLQSMITWAARIYNKGYKAGKDSI